MTRETLTKALFDTKREGIADLIGLMDTSGFWTAPASGGNHEHVEGGLAEHSLHVYENAHKIAKVLLSKKEYEAMKDSITIASILHDLGKIGDYGKKMYVPNVLKSGKQSDAKPWMRNTELTAVPHSIRSIKLATLFIDLTEDEEWAILCHDGLYDHMKYEIPGHETPLYLILHYADLWSTKVTEKEDN